MPDETTILSLPLILPAQAQKHVTHNEALAVLDLLVQLSVINRTLTAAPALPGVGDRHIVATGATGAWAGQAGRIALYTETGWQFTAPLLGWQAHVLAEGQTAVFDGVAWKVPSEAPFVASRIGVSATPDATNRLAVNAPATLLNHAGAGHQLKLNKAAAGDTASLLFQTGFSGRAEMGTAGNDDFSVKVSADGSTFFTALAAEAATGRVTLPQPLQLGGQAADPVTPPDGTLWLNTTTGEVKLRSAGVTAAVGSGGDVSDGDKGDITVSGGGAVWTIDAGVVSLGKLSAMTTASLLGRTTAGTGSPEVLTATQARGILNVANGATANATDTALRDRSTHTGTQLAASISDFATAVAATASVTANTAKVTNATHTGDVTGGAALTIAADAVTNTKLANMVTATLKGRATAGTGDPEDLTGSQATALLDTFTTVAKGLAPASGGGTANFLRADGAWTAPSGGGGGSPGGVSGELQWNNAGAFAGAADAEIEGGQLRLPTIATPSTPAAGGVKLYAATVDGTAFPAWLDPDGQQSLMIPASGRLRFLSFNDMTGATSTNEWVVANSGTGAAQSSTTPQDGGIGWVQGVTGTTATGRTAMWSGSASTLRFSLGAARYASRLRVPTLSTGTETFTLWSGFIDNIGGESADGAFFRYTHSVNGGRFQAVTRANNVETSADTGIAVVANTTYVLQVQVNAAGTSVAYLVNGAVVATVTTNIPTAAGRETSYGILGLKSLGATSVTTYAVDYISVEMWFTGR